MASSTMRHRRAGVRYQTARLGMTDSQRVLAYRARKHVERVAQKLIAAGRIDEAVEFCDPIMALMDTPPTVQRAVDLLDDLTLADAKEDVHRALYRQDPAGNRNSYLAHVRIVIRYFQGVKRALLAEEGSC